MLPEYVKFYYDKLSDVEKDVYMQMYKGFARHQKELNIVTDTSVIDLDRLMYIFRCLYNDTPSFYYVHPSMMSYAVTPTGYLFCKEFLYPEQQIAEYDKRLLDGLKAFNKTYIKPGMSEYEKERAIHNYLVMTVKYDSESIKSDEEKAKHREIYNCLGPLLRKKAVCWGISCAFKLLCDYNHIKCFVVIGDILPVKKDSNGHAWNIVKLNNETYHVDVTWDLKEKKDITIIYDYFNLDDHLIRFNHTWDDTIYPACDSVTYNYYHKNKLYVRKLDQIAPFVKERIKQGDKLIAFKIANTMPPSEIIHEEIRKGRDMAGSYKGFSWLVNETTHNVYIEMNRD